MKNTLKSAELGLVDIPSSEFSQISGGWVAEAIKLLAGLLFIVEWDTTKKAAADAWNGNYDPPKS